MQFGLTKEPTAFQRALYIAPSGYKWKTCLVYLDDVIVFSENEDDHVKHLREVLKVLRDMRMLLNIKKCSFLTKFIKNLGQIV